MSSEINQTKSTAHWTLHSCIKGVLHQGETVGSTKQLAGVTTYISLPETDSAPEKAVVYLGEL